MSLDYELSWYLSLWREGLVSAAYVVQWADSLILQMEPREYPPWLMPLSLVGPQVAQNDQNACLPQPLELSFLDRFALRAIRLNLNDRREVEEFVRWAAKAAMGEELREPAVELSYVLDHYINDCDDLGCAVSAAMKELPLMMPALRQHSLRIMPN